jgi:hypothetical protein
MAKTSEILDIRKADPVADLVKDLLAAGVTEEQLHGMLRGKMSDPLATELYNKYRDIQRGGWTTNRHGIRVTCRRSPGDLLALQETLAEPDAGENNDGSRRPNRQS